MAYNILLVDDSSIIRKVLTKTISLAGVDVGQLLEAGDGKQALEKLEGAWVDVVFLDINMPVMNGIEFARVVRGKEEYKSLPIVVVSTEGAQDRIDELTSLGIKHYLRKPVTPEALAKTVKEVLEGGAS